MIPWIDLWRRGIFQASQASATDLRLWCSYVQLLALLDCREEAIKVAEKALSMVQVKRSHDMIAPRTYNSSTTGVSKSLLSILLHDILEAFVISCACRLRHS